MDEKRIVMKLCHKGQIRRINLVERPLSIAEVQRAVSQLFPTEKAVQLTYADEDGDKITVSTDMELEEAYNVSTESSNASIIRLNVETKEVDHPSGSLLCMSFVDILDKQQQAEEDRKLKAMQEARKVKAEAKRAAERKAEEEKRKAEDEAKRKAEEEASRRLEEELQRLRIEAEREEEEKKRFAVEERRRLEEEEAGRRDAQRKVEEEAKNAFVEEQKRAKEEAIKKVEDEKKRKKELRKVAAEERKKADEEKKEKERQQYLATHPAREKGLLTLTSMGFEADACWEVLVASRDDIEVALDKLMG